MASEPDGFAAFVAARSPALLRTAWMLTGEAHMAEDLLQAALARTWPHWSRIGDDRPEAYVRAVMVRQQIAWSRRLWRRESPTGAVPDVPSVDAFGPSDDRFLLSGALAGLPLRQRQVVVLRYYEDLSEAEVARELGCSVGTVKSQASKGLAKLRGAVGPRSDEPVVEVRGEVGHD